MTSYLDLVQGCCQLCIYWQRRLQPVLNDRESRYFWENREQRRRMSTVTIPPVLTSPRDDAMHLYRAFKGTLFFFLFSFFFFLGYQARIPKLLFWVLFFFFNNFTRMTFFFSTNIFLFRRELKKKKKGEWKWGGKKSPFRRRFERPRRFGTKYLI